MKYTNLNLKKMHGICMIKLKNLNKKMKKDLNKWKYILHSWIGRFNIIIHHRFNTIPEKISVIFVDIDN